MALDVIAAGELYIDLIMSSLDRWPQPGEEAVAENFRREPGGGAAITAIGLAKLGMRAGIVAPVGGDGAWLVEMLGKCGVDTTRIGLVEQESTGTTVAISNEKDRAFFTYAGANRKLREVIAAANFAVPHLHWAGPVDPDLFSSVHGSTISLDVGFAHANGETKAVLPMVDLFFPNRVEGERMTGERDPEAILRGFANDGARTVVLKMGDEGAAMLVDGKLLHAAPPKVEAVDTTGAGDCFNAGFLCGWLRGKSPIECLRLGNVCGALSTRVLGGVAGFPTLEEIACLEK